MDEFDDTRKTSAKASSSEKKSLLDIDKRFELDKFEMESTLRRMIYEGLKDFEKSINEQKSTMATISKQLKMQSFRLSEIEAVFSMPSTNPDAKTISKFDEIFDRIEEMNRLRVKENTRLEQQIFSLKDKFDQKDYQSGHNEEAYKILQADIDKLKHRVSDLYIEQDDIKGFALTKISEANAKVLDEVNDTNSKMEKLLFNDTTYKNNFETILNKLEQNESMICNTDKILTELNLFVETLDNIKFSKSDLNNYKVYIEETIMKFNVELENCMNEFRETENFIEKYLPIKVQSMISDCLGNVLKFSQLTLLEEFEKIKYEKLYQALLKDDGTPKLVDLSEKLKEQARTRNKGEDTTDLNDEDNKVIDLNEVAIQKLESDLLSVQSSLSISIRKLEDRLRSIIKDEKDTCKQNYGELNIFFQTLHDEFENSKQDIKGEHFRLWNELKKLRIHIATLD